MSSNNTITIDYVSFVWDTKRAGGHQRTWAFILYLDNAGRALSVRAHPASGEHLHCL